MQMHIKIGFKFKIFSTIEERWWLLRVLKVKVGILCCLHFKLEYYQSKQAKKFNINGIIITVINITNGSVKGLCLTKS